MDQIKEQIKYEDFSKLDIRVGTVLSAVDVEGSEKLLKLDVDFGPMGVRQVLSGIKEWYKPESLINKQYIFVVNLEPRKIMGLDSQAMITAVDNSNDVVLLELGKEVENGSVVR